MTYNILLALLLAVLSVYVVINYRKLFLESEDSVEPKPELPIEPQPETVLINDTTGSVELVVDKSKVKKPSVKKASKKIAKKKPRRREL